MDVAIPDELLIGHRMFVDNEFNERLLASDFSSAEWDIIMSVVTFRIHEPDDPEEAQLYPQLDGVPDAIAATDDLPDFQKVQSMQPERHTSGRLERFVGRVQSALGLDVRRKQKQHERIQNAEQLISDYAEVLEIHLRQQSDWADICKAALERAE